ncbi:MAG: beta-lactamase family protein [Chloroflexi bacterium]|nr:beta-lactamase family protein [Chloroflexota bacterium]
MTMSETSERASDHTALTATLQRLAADLVVEHSLPGLVVALVDDGDIIWGQGFGQTGAPASGSRRLDLDTIFRVASITKTFTALALVQLRDEGRLRLDDPLVAHLPEFAAVRNPFGPLEDVTLRRLASHSSGLMGEPPLDHWQTLCFPTREEVLASLPDVAVMIPPGSAFKYSNLGYTLLGEVVERRAERSYIEYVREAILRPLGMASSAFALTDALAERAATGHMPHPFEDEAQPAPDAPCNGMAAAAQLWTSARDLARWIALQFRTEAQERSGNQILAGPSLAEMQQAQYVEPNWSGGYGFGWRILRRGERVYHGHGGSLPGYRSQILFDATRKIGIVALIDGTGPVDEIAVRLLDAAADRHDTNPAERPAVIAPTPPTYRRLLGMYRARHFADIARVECRGGNLLLKDAPGSPFPGGPPTRLEPTADPLAFVVRGGRYSGEMLTFSVADDGHVIDFRAAGFAYRRLSDADGHP